MKPLISVLLPVLIKEDWQIPMTRAAIDIMRATTALPYQLVVVETPTLAFADTCDEHIHYPQPAGFVKELNAGLQACTGDYIVCTGNDIFMKPGWLDALLECFTLADCGVATLASSDLKHQPRDAIEEGVWGPLMMFRNGQSFDPDYKRLFIDTDLIMRFYENGQRAYRNWRVVVTHLNQQTEGTIHTLEENQCRMEEGRAMFRTKHEHKASHLFMYHALTQGWVV